MAQRKRTYIRCVAVGTQTAMFELPEWKPGVWIEMSKWSVPPFERPYLHPGFRCNVTINIDAECQDQLDLEKWGLD